MTRHDWLFAYEAAIALWLGVIALWCGAYPSVLLVLVVLCLAIGGVHGEG